MPRLFACIALLAFAIGAPMAHANDSEVEWAVGGLVYKANPHISMDSEDLYISEEEVRVTYRYTNHSDEPQTLLVSFPLPMLPGPEGYEEYGNYPDLNAFTFETRVDHEVVMWTVVDRALRDGEDVTDQVIAKGWPVLWAGDYEFVASIAALPREEQQALQLDGWLDEYGYPAWQAQRHFVREQTFAPRETVEVFHRYRPIIGGSVGGALHKNVREEVPEVLAEYRRDFCVDDFFLRGFDRMTARKNEGAEDDPVMYGETWIGYVLKTGANWRGPIKDFRLVVDKGATDRLVSFCMDGVTKISPTRFEVRKKDYVPQDDLRILIVKWYDGND